jgi:Glycosyl transferase 4-like domain
MISRSPWVRSPNAAHGSLLDTPIPRPRALRRLLIVAPHFPPVNAPDMHRVRMSLAHYRSFGWDPIVLTVDAARQPEPTDALLVETIPSDVAIIRTGALPLAFTRLFGVGNVAIRAYAPLRAAGLRIIRDAQIDLVFFSTTMFLCMPLGRVWRRKTKTPFVVDLQDPWASDYQSHDGAGPPKYGLARRVHARLEPWTMKRASGIVAVSPAYIDTIRRRYPWIAEEACATIPFGVALEDFAAAARTQPAVSREPLQLTGVYVGAGGPAMATALRILFAAVRRLHTIDARLAEKLRLAFIGTDYAPAGRGKKTVEPLAAEAGVSAQVTEQTDRVPYFVALQTLRAANFVLLIGSDDAQYTASKAGPCLASRRPIVAILHADSPGVALLKQSQHTILVTFRSGVDIDPASETLAAAFPQVAELASRELDVDAGLLEPYTAKALTARQCALFDRVIEREARAA